MACPTLTIVPSTQLVEDLAATVMLQLRVRLLSARLCSGGEMLFKVAFALLILWLIGKAGVYPDGAYVDALLLVGLMVLLVAFLKARDTAIRRTVRDSRDTR